jgi:RibD C-terminal domain
MKRIHYSVAMSLDGYIAGPRGESDWIILDPDIDFGALMSDFDTILMGRRTSVATAAHGGVFQACGLLSYHRRLRKRTSRTSPSYVSRSRMRSRVCERSPGWISGSSAVALSFSQPSGRRANRHTRDFRDSSLAGGGHTIAPTPY